MECGKEGITCGIGLDGEVFFQIHALKIDIDFLVHVLQRPR